jgi:hypothetical protein
MVEHKEPIYDNAPPFRQRLEGPRQYKCPHEMFRLPTQWNSTHKILWIFHLELHLSPRCPADKFVKVFKEVIRIAACGFTLELSNEMTEKVGEQPVSRPSASSECRFSAGLRLRLFKKRLSSLFMIPVVLAGMVVLSGCGQQGATVAAMAETTHINGSGASVTVHDKRGTDTFSSVNGAVPAGFPSRSVPLPSGARISSSIGSDSSHHKKVWVLTLKAPAASISGILQQYRRQLVSLGFRVEESVSDSSSSSGFTELALKSAQWQVIVATAGAGEFLLTVQSV